jgi:hypothetical protein
MVKQITDSLLGRLSALKWIVNVSLDLYRGFKTLHGMGPVVTVFGSARTLEGSSDYELARALGRELAHRGFTVITGGGPGVMAAANRGAKEVGGHSVGCSISLLKHEPVNAYVDRNVAFKYFFIRKLMLTKYSCAFVAAPGGFGTLDELFEIITLIQTGKIKRVPVFLMNKKYWAPILSFAQKEMLSAGTISRSDLDLLILCDDPNEIVTAIISYQQGKVLNSLPPVLEKVA